MIAAGWLAAALLGAAVLRLRRRLELVARAEHELRGPLTAFSFAVERARRGAGGRSLAEALDSELARARAGLADLSAARQGRRAAPRGERVALERLVRSCAAAWAPAARAVRLDWRAGETVVRADETRVAQALGNAMANAVEHGGGGEVLVRGVRDRGRVRVEIVNGAERGRGLAIAAAAARDAGGELHFARSGTAARSTLELPLAG